MGRVPAGITISVDGFITGPGGGSGCGLGAGGERLFDGFGGSLELEHLGVRQSPFAAFVGYRVKN